ncbi:uncharacterized protein LOC123301604 [Chrysoperla carnea]|uniref:uncharacterized protein LOC123301604 n=1 Tax=Chrysoperla carnea TaxID=189513 RepID=UPI001D093CE2|nr:uncharacterized protein LOC123301604 [Chrysoperla carnea]
MQILLRSDRIFFIKTVLFLFLLLSTQCLADEPELAKNVQAEGQAKSEAKNNIEKVENDEVVADETPESDEILLPIQNATEDDPDAETTNDISPEQENTVKESVDEASATKDSAETPVVEDNEITEQVSDTNGSEDETNPTNLVESEQSLPKKERVNLLPEEQAAGGVYGKQVAHVPGNRPPSQSSQSPLGGIASLFGGFRRAVVGGANANLAGAGDDPEVERAQKLKSGFEKMIQLVNVLGQVDSFLSDRTRSVVRRLSMLAESGEDDRYRRASHYHRRHHY